MAMVRKQIYIEAQQEAQLKSISLKLAISEAELIRQGIHHYLCNPSSVPLNLARWDEAKKFMITRNTRSSSKGKRNWAREDIYE